ADPAVGRNVVTVVVPGARRRVVAQVEGDERHTGLDQAAGQQRLLTPEVLAVPLADPRVFLVDVEGVPRASAGQQLDRLLTEGVEAVLRPGAAEPRAERVELGQERPAGA